VRQEHRNNTLVSSKSSLYIAEVQHADEIGSGDGLSLELKIMDRCPKCGTYDLDLPSFVYDELAGPTEPGFGMTWYYV
jgi:hypothetical protein